VLVLLLLERRAGARPGDPRARGAGDLRVPTDDDLLAVFVAWPIGRLGAAPPPLLEARAALQDDPEAARQHLMAREGMLGPVASVV
jgi:hypothetical protein